MRKIPGLVKAVMDLCLHSLTQIYDDPAWASKDDAFDNYTGDEHDDDDEMSAYAAATLDRLAKALGGKVVWPTFRECSGPYFASGEWQRRRAALVSLSLILEGCKRTLLPQAGGAFNGTCAYAPRSLVRGFPRPLQLRQLVLDTVAYAKDPHLRVRHAALRALGQITLDFTDPNALETVSGADIYASLSSRDGM